MMTGTCFDEKKLFCNAKFGDFGGLWGQGVKICDRKCHIWNRRPWFAYSLCNFYGATMMISLRVRSLLLSAPIVKHFRSKKLSPVLGKIWRFWGIKRGLKLNLNFITPKRHILAWFHIFWAIARKNLSTGLAWNALPDDLRDPSLSADNFRKKLKTHLFRNAFGHIAH